MTCREEDPQAQTLCACDAEEMGGSHGLRVFDVIKGVPFGSSLGASRVNLSSIGPPRRRSPTVCSSPARGCACTSASSAGSNGSSCQATLRRTDSAARRAEQRGREVRVLAGELERQLADGHAVLLDRMPRRRGTAAGLPRWPDASPAASRPLSRPLPNGEPLMMPMSFCRASGSSSSSARVVQAVVVVDQRRHRRQQSRKMRCHRSIG